MGIITNISLTGIADRLAKQYEHVQSGLDAANQAGEGDYYLRVHSGVGALGDSDVEEDLVPEAADLDEDFLIASSAQLIFTDFVSALDTHVRNQDAAGMNAYLTTSGINVHDFFADIFAACKGQNLNAINVFCPRELTLATICFAGSGTGSWTDGTVLGTGTGEYSDTNHAAATLVAEVQNSSLCSGVEIDLCLTKEDGSAEWKTVSIAGGSPIGTRSDVGTHPGDAYLDVTDAVWAGGCSGMCVGILSEIERTLSL